MGKADVFSVGMILLEICSLQPSSECYDEESYNIVDSGKTNLKSHSHQRQTGQSCQGLYACDGRMHQSNVTIRSRWKVRSSYIGSIGPLENIELKNDCDADGKPQTPATRSTCSTARTSWQERFNAPARTAPRVSTKYFTAPTTPWPTSTPLHASTGTFYF